MTIWDNLTRTQRAFEKDTEPARKFQEALDRAHKMYLQSKLDFSKKFLESLHTQGSPYQQLQKQIYRIDFKIPYDATNILAEELNKLTRLSYNPLQEIAESLNKTQTILSFDHLLKENLFFEIEHIAESLNFKQLTIDEYGTITLGQDTAVAEEVADTIKKFTDILESHKPTEATSNLLNFISDLKEPLRAVVIYIFKCILLPFIIIVLATIYVPEIESYIKPYQDNNFTKRQIQKKAQVEFGNEILDGLAFVTADKLNVREHPTRKSKRITQIYKGQVVTVIEKQRKWTLVSIENKGTGEFITGWVFSRYIYKLHN